MLSTEIQRSVRLNKKKKSTNISPYPDEAIERLARAFYPAILACWNSEEGQREFAAWQAEQAHIATKEKQEVPVGELPALLSFTVIRKYSQQLINNADRQGAKKREQFVKIFVLSFMSTKFTYLLFA